MWKQDPEGLGTGGPGIYEGPGRPQKNWLRLQRTLTGEVRYGQPSVSTACEVTGQAGEAYPHSLFRPAFGL